MTGTADKREANVVLVLRAADATSEEVLDATSDEVLETVEKHAARIALGPAIALNPNDCSIKLRFDVMARNSAEVHKQIAKVIAIIEERVSITLTQSNVDARAEAEATTSEFATASPLP